MQLVKSTLPFLLIASLASITLDHCEAAPQPHPNPQPGVGTGGSKCEGTNCTPAPGGTTCTSTYDRDDGCCPVWHCANGQSIYGKSSGGATFSSSSNSFSFGTPPQFGQGGGGFPGFPAPPSFPGMPAGFPFFG